MSEKRVNDLTPTSSLSGGGVSFLVDGTVTNKIEYSDLLDSLRANLLNGGDLKFYYFTSNENSADYIKMGEIEVSAHTFNVFFVATIWATGKPLGIKIVNDSVTFAQEENDSGYLGLCYVFPTGGADDLLEFYEKTNAVSGNASKHLLCLQFSFSIQ